MSNPISSSSEDSKMNIEHIFKIMILGETSVGKTSFITRYISDKFCEKYICTIGIDFCHKIVERNNKIIKLQIWDTAGQERYRNVAKSYFQATHGFIVAYDINNMESFKKVKYWVEQIKTISDESIKCILIGTKCDLDKRKVEENEASDFAKNLGYKFFETSAKLDINVNETFECLIDDILLNYKNKKRNSVMLSSKKLKKQKKKCC